MTIDPLAALPKTKQGRYVLTTSRLHGWAAFDVNDILLIEEEALAPPAIDPERLARAIDVCLTTTGYKNRKRFAAAIIAAYEAEP